MLNTLFRFTGHVAAAFAFIAFVLVAAPTASAQSVSSVAGRWDGTWRWDGSEDGHGTFVLNADGTFRMEDYDFSGRWGMNGPGFWLRIDQGLAAVYSGRVNSDGTITGSLSNNDNMTGTFTFVRSSGGGGAGKPGAVGGGGGGGSGSWRAIAGDWRLISNLRGNTCSAYYRFVDQGAALAWYSGADASHLGVQTATSNFSDLGNGVIFYTDYDDQHFQIVGDQLVRSDSSGARFCTFRRVR